MVDQLRDSINLWIDSIMDECQVKHDQSPIFEKTLCELNKYMYSVNDYNIRNTGLIKRNFTVDRVSLPHELSHSSWEDICEFLRTHAIEQMVSSGPYSDRRIRIYIKDSVSTTKRSYVGISDHYETTSMAIVIELLPSPHYSCVIC